MTYPTAAVTTTNLDASGDSPALARSDILDGIQKLNQMIAHTTAFAATLLDDIDAGTARGTLVAAKSGGNTDITSLGAVASINGGQLAGLRNRIINGNFGVNQRAYTSGGVVGANLYGHDRWKMAASGDTYTFSTTANVTTVTIPSGKVLQQVIEGLNLETGTYTLSWVGTAQGKIGAGSYGASGITGAITGGTNITIEFGPGTVSKVQLEFGSVATAFEQRPYGMELALCQRYYYRLKATAGGDFIAMGYKAGTTSLYVSGIFPVKMRATPTLETSGVATDYSCGGWEPGDYKGGQCTSIPANVGAQSAERWSLAFSYSFAGFTVGLGGEAIFTSGVNGYLGWRAEL